MFLNWEWPAMQRSLGFVREEMGVNRGLIGRQSGEIKDLRPARLLK
jgi:hypothetical protein